MYLIHAITPTEYYTRFFGRNYIVEYSQGDDYNNISDTVIAEDKLTQILDKTDNDVFSVIFEEEKHTGIMQAILRESNNRGCLPVLFKLISYAAILLTLLCIGKSMQAQSWTVKDNCKQLAIILESRYQIPSELTLAIYAHESAHGKSNVAFRYNNYFGIRERTVVDDYDYYSYRKFESKVQCFVWFGNMLRNGKIYPECLDQDIENIVLCMADKGYSQDPEWANHIITLINQK